MRESNLSIHSFSEERTRAFLSVRESNLSIHSLSEERTRAFIPVREPNLSTHSLSEERTRAFLLWENPIPPFVLCQKNKLERNLENIF